MKLKRLTLVKTNGVLLMGAVRRIYLVVNTQKVANEGILAAFGGSNEAVSFKVGFKPSRPELAIVGVQVRYKIRGSAVCTNRTSSNGGLLPVIGNKVIKCNQT